MEEDDTASEQISDSFLCAICLDILYKPIVLACGHISCFWCVHWSMSNRHESHCPICRKAYNHFPAICQMLHFLLKKIYPVSYGRKEKQILEDEKKRLCFSPNVDSLVSSEELNHLGDVGQSSNCNSEDSFSGHAPTEKGEPCANPSQLELISSDDIYRNIYIESSEENFGIPNLVAENKKLHERSLRETCEQISVDDVLCVVCKKLLFRPVVLNCGHVYCEACLIIATERPRRCQVCLCRHPNGCPKVCLELDHFIEEHFPSEYALRRSGTSTLPQEVQLLNGNPSNKTDTQGRDFSLPPEDNFLQWMADHALKYHTGVGCDSCGMMPIVGDRYKCKDCTDRSGFDLCGDCHKTCLIIHGRFNQRHTPEHKLELVEPDPDPHIILRLFSGQLAYVSASLNLHPNAGAVGSPENESPTPNEDPESPITLADRSEDQNGNQSPDDIFIEGFGGFGVD